jgi:hypothetical protein
MNRFFALFILLLTFASTLAQTIVFSDNFDSYTAGSTLSASNPSWWSTWGHSPEQDGVIVNTLAASAPNSLHISNANDQIFFVNPIDASTNYSAPFRNGHYTISFNYYVPSQGPGAYFNVQQDFGYFWAFATYFRNNGTGYFIAGGDTTEFSYPSNAWFPILVDVDLSHDYAMIKVNNVTVKTWPWHYSQEYQNLDYLALDVINFFSLAPGDIPGDYYVDDFTLTEIEAFSDTLPVNADTLWFSTIPNDIDTIELEINNPDYHNITVKNIITYDIPNPDMTPTGIIELDNHNDSIYSIVKCDSLPYDNMQIQYMFDYAFEANELKPHIGKTIQKVRFPLGEGAISGRVSMISTLYDTIPGKSHWNVLSTQPFVPVEGWNEVILTTPAVIDGSHIWVYIEFEVRTDSCYTLVIGDSIDMNKRYLYGQRHDWVYSNNVHYSQYDPEIDSRTIPISIAIDGTPIAQWLDIPSEMPIGGNGSETAAVTAHIGNMNVGERRSAKIHMFSDRFKTKVLPVNLLVSQVGVNEHNEIEVKIFPNPASDFMKITSAEILRVEVYNMKGQKLIDNRYSGSHVVIPTSDLPAGIYVVNVTTSAGKTSKKVVVR